MTVIEGKIPTKQTIIKLPNRREFLKDNSEKKFNKLAIYELKSDGSRVTAIAVGKGIKI